MKKKLSFFAKTFLRVVLLTVSLAGSFNALAQNSCTSGETLLPYQGLWLVSGPRQKCNIYPEFVNVDPCEVKEYLKETINTSSNSNTLFTNYTAEAYTEPGLDASKSYTYGIGYYNGGTNQSYSATSVTTYDTSCTMVSQTFSGSLSSENPTDDSRTNNYTTGFGSSYEYSLWTDAHGSDTITGTLTNSGWVLTEDKSYCQYTIEHIEHPAGPNYDHTNYPCYTNTITVTTNYPSVAEVSGTEVLTQTTRTITASPAPPGGSGTTVHTLANEFTTCDLIGKCIADLNAQSYDTDGMNWQPSVVIGDLEGQRFVLEELDKAKFWYTYQSKTNKSYVITTYFTTLSIGCALGGGFDVTESQITTNINGDGFAHDETFYLDPVCENGLVGYKFSGDGTILGGKAELTIVILDKITIKESSGSCSSGTCLAQGFGNAQLQLSATLAQANFGLGQTRAGQGVGQLELQTILPSVGLATPRALKLSAPADLVTKITNSSGGSLRQIGASQCLVDIVPVTAYQYQLIFYPTNALLPGHDGVTLISTNGLVPVVTWTIVNPDGATASNRLQVFEIRGGQTISNQFSYNGTSNQWQLDSGNGLSRTLMKEDWGTTHSRTETIQVINPADGSILRQTVDHYGFFSWGNVLTNQISGVGTNTVTNSYTYNTSGDSVGRVKSLVRGDGTWENYYYDSQGRLTDLFSPYGTNTIPIYNRILLYSYEPWTDFGDDPTLYPLEPRKVWDEQFGTCRYFIASNNMTISIVCAPNTATTSYEPFDVASLCTTNWYYTNGDVNATKLQRVDHPDNTLELYTYGTNALHQTNIVYSGAPNSGRTAVVDGTETISVYGPAGQLEFHQVIDVASGIVMSQETYSSFDPQGRATLVTYLDGTTTSYDYDCCNLSSVTDRDGLTTSYTYDGLKRRISETKYVAGMQGITTSNIFDVAGNLIMTTLTGTNGTSTITNWSAAYDAAGRMIRETNALGGTTFYYFGFDPHGLYSTTTVYPDQGTRNELHCPDGNLYQVSGTAVHGVRYNYDFEYSFPCSHYTQEIKINPDGSATDESEIHYYDYVEREVRLGYADGNYDSTSYNALGQMFKQRDADGVITLYAYNARGEQEITAKHVDSGLGDTIQYSGTDRITKVVKDVLSDSALGTTVQRSRTYVWDTLNTASSNLVSQTETSTDGLTNWHVLWNGSVGITNRTVTAYASGGFRYEYNYAPDGSYSYQVYQYGRLLSAAKKNATGQTITQTTYTYDLFNRTYASTDLRNGATTYAYNNAGQTTNITTPYPGDGNPPQTTLTYYDTMQRPTNVVSPDGNSAFTTYFLTGEISQQWGARAYHVGYSYDYAGRHKTMTNWSNFASLLGARVTTWNYDSQRGWLSGKTYDDGIGPVYGYTAAGRMSSRLWARGTNTAYTYTSGGDLATVIYNDTVTAGITNGYDRLGRQTIVSNGATVCTFTYNNANRVLSESYAGGPLDGISITNGYDNLLRRTNVVTLKSGVLTTASYGYDGISRLQSVSDGTNSAAYGYLTNSPLVSQITFAQSGTTRMTTGKQYDALNRLTWIRSTNGSGVIVDSHGYAYNSANQRTTATNTDASQWNYQYDPLGQVTSGRKRWNDGTSVAGQQFGYTYDDIGNRYSTLTGGDNWGANLRNAGYGFNTLNQYIARIVPGAVDVMGSATNTATVTVNNQRAERHGDYYRAQVHLDNSSGPVYAPLTNLAVQNQGSSADLIASNSGNVFLPQTPENFTYDADGNLMQDGRWTYSWDGENRLINITSLSGAPAASKLSADYAYDFKGRRNQKLLRSWNGSAYAPQSTNLFLYDGWNAVAELNAANNAMIRSYMWGSDLSGSLQGAGGVGGLLKMAYGSTNCFIAFDGNGNVSGLANATNGIISDHYEYGPFGETIKVDGSMAKVNPIRFSTKYLDGESDLLNYGYRLLTTSLGRWLNRDPLDEIGSRILRNKANTQINSFYNSTDCAKPVYGFVLNSPENHFDSMGLDVYKMKETHSSGSSSCIKHRYILGNYGHNKPDWSYRIELGVKHETRHFCGLVADVSYVIFEEKHFSLKKHVAMMISQGDSIMEYAVTSEEVDTALENAGKRLADRDWGLYILIFRDCGNFANTWMDTARNWENAWWQAVSSDTDWQPPYGL